MYLAIVRFSGGEHYSSFPQVRTVLSSDPHYPWALICFYYSALHRKRVDDSPPPAGLPLHFMNKREHTILCAATHLLAIPRNFS